MIKEPTVRKAVDLAIETEEIGIKFYQRVAKKFEDKPEVAETFRRLSDDEKIHAERFRKILEQEAPEDAPPVSTERYRLEYLRAISRSEIFKREQMENLREKVESMEDALQLAIDLEKNTLHLYLGLRDTVGEHEALDQIIEEERNHIVRIFSMLEKIKA
jgi:rubrerythrin